MSSSRGTGPAVHQITSAQEPLSREQARRSRRYLIQMGIRTVCFILAVVVTGPLRWVFLVAAIVLPYIAVVFANAGRERSTGTPELMIPYGLPNGDAPSPDGPRAQPSSVDPGPQRPRTERSPGEPPQTVGPRD